MPRLAVNMMVLNGATVLRRCLLPLAGVVDEVVVIDTGSEDDTRDVLADIAAEMKLDHFYYERLAPYSDDFMTDEAETWGNSMPGPFTGRRLLKDWAKVRNLALDNTTADYVLKLDADDEVISPPENISKALSHLDLATTIGGVSAPYEIYDGQGNIEWLSMYLRLWRRSESLRWSKPMHEFLKGVTDKNIIFAAQGIRVRDWRDSPGDGVRLVHRNLKVLLWNHMNRSALWEGHSDPDFTFTMAHEAVEVFPGWSRNLLASVMKRCGQSDLSSLADCHYHTGRAFEAEDTLPEAVTSYIAADEANGGRHTQALLKAIGIMQRSGDGDLKVLKERVLTRVGTGSGDPLLFNCELKLIKDLRQEVSEAPR